MTTTLDRTYRTLLASFRPDADVDRPRPWHSGVDVGLLVLRLVLGGIVGAHGLQKLLGVLGGTGIDGFARVLTGFGFTGHTTLLAWVTGLTEVGGSVLLVLGLLTPLGAAGLLGVALNIVVLRAPTGFFLESARDGIEFQLLLAAVALALLFTGSGRIALDRATPWGRRPVPFGLAGLGLAVVTSAAVLLLFH